MPPQLKVGGITPFSATDYPGKLATVVFVQGCPWRCGYCHNPHLQPLAPGAVAWADVLALLDRREGLIDAVVFSGGEPTIDPALPAAIRAVRARGFSVGLHTACIFPRQLAGVLPLVDWIGFDVKAPFRDYERITGVAASGKSAQACVEQIVASGKQYECRTTVHPALLGEADLLALADTLAEAGVRNYALQEFRAQGCADPLLRTHASALPEAPAVAAIAARFEHFTLRRAD